MKFPLQIAPSSESCNPPEQIAQVKTALNESEVRNGQYCAGENRHAGNLDYSIHTSASAGLSFPMNLEATITEVWRQALLENAKFVILASQRFPVRLTPRSKLRQVDFFFDGIGLRGLEQNPHSKSRWAQLARSGKKVMQFLSDGRYIANVVDGKPKMYGKRSS